MRGSNRAALVLLVATLTLLPVVPVGGAATVSEPCEAGSAEMCDVTAYYYRRNAKLTEEQGSKLAADPDTVVIGWHGTPYHGALRLIPTDMTFHETGSMQVVMYRDVTRTDTYTTDILVKAFDEATGESVTLFPRTSFVADVEAMLPPSEGGGGEPPVTPPAASLPRLTCSGRPYCPAMDAYNTVATAIEGALGGGTGGSAEDAAPGLQENWNVFSLDFGSRVTVPAGWTIEVQTFTYVGEGHAEQPVLDGLSHDRFNPSAVPRPSIIHRQDSAEFPSHVDFRLVA